MKSKLTALLAATVIAGLGVASAAQATVYSLNRSIGASGAVSGYFETDGTTGALKSGNFIDWSLTIASPNLFGGTPQILDRFTAFLFTTGGASATASQLLFDMTAGRSNNITVQSFSTFDYWCLSGCVLAGHEVLGANSNPAFAFAEATDYSSDGAFVFASVSEPATLGLFGLGLVGLGLAARRRKTR